MPNTNIGNLYEYTLQQMAAESYFEGLTLSSATIDQLIDKLRLGANRREFQDGSPDLNEGYRGFTRMTESQATEFLSQFQIVHQWSDNPTAKGSRPITEGIASKPQLNDEILANTGLSATLIRARDASGNLTNEYTLAIRSTEYRSWADGGDGERDKTGADINSLAFNGFALAQLDALEQYYQWLKDQGNLLPSGSKLNVTGYSLGGHLATVFTEIHQNDSDIVFGETVTFNGAGRGTWNTSAGTEKDMLAYYHRVLQDSAQGPTPSSEDAYLLGLRASAIDKGNTPFSDINIYNDPRYLWALAATRETFGLSTLPLSNEDRTGTLADNRITQVFGYENIINVNVTANSGIHGPAVRVGIESQPLIEGLFADFGNGHSITLIADSLALQRALHQLDSTFTLDKFIALLPSATFRKPVSGANADYEFDALENILDPLARLFLVDPIKTTFKSGASGFGDIGNRTVFHDNLESLANSQAFKAIAGTARIEMLGNKAVDFLIGIAGTSDDRGLAYRYALSELNPFALLGVSYTPKNQNGELDIYDSATDEGTLTSKWLADRAAMLTRKLWFGEQNKDPVKATLDASTDTHPFQTDASYFLDVASGYQIAQGFSPERPPGGIHHYLFGGIHGDHLKGRGVADHLYGGSGNDALFGNGGIDYLEGGIDNDILVGGADDDVLNGGKGLDSYLWTNTPGFWGSRIGAGNDGTDTLIDSDKLGRIFINGQGVKLLIQTSNGLWTSPDGKVTLTQDETWKIATTGEGGIDLGSAFEDGHFGIHRLQVAVGGTRIVGDLQPIDHDVATPEIDIERDALGNVKVHANQAAAGREDRLYGSPEADRILGMDGSDRIDGLGGDDLIEGGSGSDIVIGDWGNDTVFGESGPSATSATTAQVTAAIKAALERGDSATNQTQRGDLVAGQTGNDILVGGDAQDLITGGEGNDLLIGGAGNDMLIGDGEVSFAEADWSVRRLPENDTIYRWQTVRSGVAVSDEIGGADMLYGGKGADWLFAGAGDDLLDGGADDDVLFGDAGNDVLRGGDGADVLSGDAGELPEHLHGADWIDGGIGDDRIYGNSGDDVLTGGRGVDIINGGAGRDTYIFYAGDGVDKLSDPDTGENASIMVFGPGFDKNSITLEKGSLLINLGNGDEIHIENFNAADPLADPSFSSFQFDDGTSLSWEELLALGFSIVGTEYDDQGELGQLDGTGVADRIFGLAGDDVLVGLDGDDVLNGGEGIDVMAGGAGDDIYDIRVGDALPDVPFGIGDFILDDGGTDTLRLMQHDPAAIHFGLAADVLAEDGTLGNALMITAGLDRIVLFDPSLNNAEGVIDFVEFGNGERVALADLPVVGRTLSTSQVGATLIGTWAADSLTVSGSATGVSIDGGKGNDFINATAGSASIVGGSGDDSIYAYGSGNTLVYTVGDGADNVTLSLSSASDNVLRLHGVSEADLALSKSPVLPVGAGDTPLIINIGTNSNDSIQLFGLDHSQLLEQRPFDHISFDDGSTLSYAALLASGVDIAGTAAGESLNGTSIDDRLSGGAGDDFLVGGAGNDIYTFNLGDGADTIIDLEGANTLRFGEGLTRAAMSVTQSIAGTETAINLDFGNGDKVSIMRREFDGVQTFRFADGTTAMTECANSMRGESMQFRMTLEKSTRKVKLASWCSRHTVNANNENNWEIAV